MTIYERITSTPPEEVPEVLMHYFDGITQEDFRARPTGFIASIIHAQRPRMAEILAYAFPHLCPAIYEDCPDKSCLFCIADYLEMDDSIFEDLSEENQ